MKKVLKSLEKQKEKIEGKIEQRNFYFEERSEEWQDSDKAYLYAEKTEELDDVLSEI